MPLDIKLLEQFIDAKLERLLVGARVAMADMEGKEILSLMFPIEQRLETLREKLGS